MASAAHTAKDLLCPLFMFLCEDPRGVRPDTLPQGCSGHAYSLFPSFGYRAQKTLLKKNNVYMSSCVWRMVMWMRCSKIIIKWEEMRLVRQTPGICTQVGGSWGTLELLLWSTDVVLKKGD